MSILVSICVLAYNHEKYIADALDSFISQDTNFKFEILVHDDASTDNTPEIIKYYKDMYPNLIKPIFQTENQHSKGIKIFPKFLFPKAQGRFIAFCEGDDYWIDNKKLQKQVDFLVENKDYKMVFHPVKVVDVNKKYTHRIIGLKTNISRKASLRELVVGGVVHLSSIIVLKDVLLNLPPWYYDIKYIGTDFALTLKICAEGDVYYYNKVMSAYRTGVENSMMTLRKNTFTKEKEILLLKERINVLNAADHFYAYKYREDLRFINLIDEIIIIIYDGLFKKRNKVIRKEFIRYHSRKKLLKMYIIHKHPKVFNILTYFSKCVLKKKQNFE